MSELATTQNIRASATLTTSETVTLSNNQLFRYAKEAMFIFTVSAKVGALDFNIALQSSTDGTTFYTVEDMGDYSVNGTFTHRIDGSSIFGQYQQLYLTFNGGTSCTLGIKCEMVEVL